MNERGKGFTLAELLAVVAIIAVLVAVSIPIFNSQLEKTRKATDMANERAAKAAALTMYYTTDPALKTGSWTYYSYDAENGKLYTEANSTPTKVKKVYGQYSNNQGKVVVVMMQYDGYRKLNVKIRWIQP